MKKIFLTLAVAISAMVANAQVATSDAAWCNAVEQALRDNGIQANARSDYQNGQKTLSVTANGKTSHYSLNNTFSNGDYSSPVYIVVDRPYYNDYNNRRGGDPRMWMGERSSIYHIDDVYSNPADYNAFESMVNFAAGRPERVSVVDANYAQQAINQGVTVLFLKSNITTLQHAEQWAPPKPDAPRGSHPKVERYFAYAEAHLQLTDYRTGEVVWQYRANENYNTFSYTTDPMKNVLDRIANNISNAISQKYPSHAPRLSAQGYVLKMAEVKKDKAETVFINLGSSHDVYKSDQFDVYLPNNVGGASGLTKIGTVKIAEVQGPDLSLCDVKKGEKEIYAALQQGTKLVVRSTW